MSASKAAFNRLRDAKYVGDDQNAQDIVTLLDAYESLRARMQELERELQFATKTALAFSDIDHSAEVQRVFDEEIDMPHYFSWTKDSIKRLANNLLAAAGVKERVK